MLGLGDGSPSSAVARSVFRRHRLCQSEQGKTTPSSRLLSKLEFSAFLHRQESTAVDFAPTAEKTRPQRDRPAIRNAADDEAVSRPIVANFPTSSLTPPSQASQGAVMHAPDSWQPGHRSWDTTLLTCPIQTALLLCTPTSQQLAVTLWRGTGSFGY